MPIYMQYGSVKGDVTESSHTSWIELVSVNWGVNRPVTNPTGSATARALASARVTELTISKQQDVASIPLIEESLNGSPKPVKLDFVRTGPDQQDVYYSVELKEALVTAFSQNAGGGDRPTESLTLNFTEISLHGMQMDQDGSAASPSSYAWSVAKSAPA